MYFVLMYFVFNPLLDDNNKPTMNSKLWNCVFADTACLLWTEIDIGQKLMRLLALHLCS